MTTSNREFKVTSFRAYRDVYTGKKLFTYMMRGAKALKRKNRAMRCVTNPVFMRVLKALFTGFAAKIDL